MARDLEPDVAMTSRGVEGTQGRRAGLGGQKQGTLEGGTGAYMELQLPHACIYPATQAEASSAIQCSHRIIVTVTTASSKATLHYAIEDGTLQSMGMNIFNPWQNCGCAVAPQRGQTDDVHTPNACHVGKGNTSRLKLEAHGCT